jgi:hypothetical protein
LQLQIWRENVCEENEPTNLNYNVLLTTLELNVVVKLVVPIVTIKSTLTCTNCDKTNQSVEICHNRKSEVLVVPTTTIKSTKPIIKQKHNLLN